MEEEKEFIQCRKKLEEEFIRKYFSPQIIDIFGGIETMSTFPILEWDPEWNDLTDQKRFCPTEPRWIAKEKITAPFMMGVATDHNNYERPFVLIRTMIEWKWHSLPWRSELQIFMLYRYNTTWFQTCWTSHRSINCTIEDQDEEEYVFNEFDPRYDDASSIFEDKEIKYAKEEEELKIITEDYKYDPRIHGAYVIDELDDYSWNSEFKNYSEEHIEKKLADTIRTLCTQKSIMAKHDPELDELVEYKIY